MKLILFLMIATVGYSAEIDFWRYSEIVNYKPVDDSGDQVSISIDKSTLRIMVTGNWWVVPPDIIKDYDIRMDVMRPVVKYWDEYEGGLYEVVFSLHQVVGTEARPTGSWLSLFVSKSRGYLSVTSASGAAKPQWYSLPEGKKLNQTPFWKKKNAEKINEPKGQP
jgi:hypothetical protein